MQRATMIAIASVALFGCPQPHDARNPEACAQYDACGVCVNQPQCGWCVRGGEGVCVPNRGETDPGTAPDSCGDGHTWYFLTRDDPELPEGAPYCPRELGEGEATEEAGEGTEPVEATPGGESETADEVAEGEAAP